eukprot:1923370-Rhodomonas_salina.4
MLVLPSVQVLQLGLGQQPRVALVPIDAVDENTRVRRDRFMECRRVFVRLLAVVAHVERALPARRGRGYYRTSRRLRVGSYRARRWVYEFDHVGVSRYAAVQLTARVPGRLSYYSHSTKAHAPSAARAQEVPPHRPSCAPYAVSVPGMA